MIAEKTALSYERNLAVVRAVAPRDALNGVDFNITGSTDGLGRGKPVHAVGHPSPDRKWYRPVQNVYVSGSRDGMITFELNTGRATGLSGEGLFDSEFYLMGMILKDAPPETLARPIDVAMDQLRKWGYDVALRRRTTSTTDVSTGFKQGVDNVIFVAPLGWSQQQAPDGSIVLGSPRSFNARIIIHPGRQLAGRFEDMFDAEVRKMNAVSLTTQVRMIQTVEGFRARFVEGVIMVNFGGITNPQMQPMHFLYMACDPLDRYESFTYYNDRYSFEADRKYVDAFIESLDYHNSLRERERLQQRKPPGRH